MVYTRELPQFFQRKNAESLFTVKQTFLISVIVPGLISQHRFAERIESVLFAIVARDSFHLLTPFPWGCRVDFSLSANMTPETPDSARFFENFQKYF